MHNNHKHDISRRKTHGHAHGGSASSYATVLDMPGESDGRARECRRRSGFPGMPECAGHAQVPLPPQARPGLVWQSSGFSGSGFYKKYQKANGVVLTHMNL